jgi:hypothetical protein
LTQPRLTLDTFNNVQTGNAGFGGNFIASSPIGWRDSFRLFRGGNQVGSIGMDSSGTKLQIFTGPSGDDADASVTIDPLGNVGIGTTSSFADSKLSVEGGSGNGVRGDADSDIGVWGKSHSGWGVYGESDTSSGVHGASDTGDGVVGVSYGHFGVAGYTTVGTGVYGDNGNSNTNGHAGYFNGRVHITGNLIVDGTFSNPSDIRLKEQIQPLRYGLSELLRLQPVTWKWRAEPAGELQLGLVAQEVEHVLPEVVQHDPDPDQPLGLNYVGLMPVTIKRDPGTTGKDRRPAETHH